MLWLYGQATPLTRGDGSRPEAACPSALGPQSGYSRAWPRVRRPLPLAKPRSHLAAPWPGPPATWTGLYAFLVKREG